MLNINILKIFKWSSFLNSQWKKANQELLDTTNSNPKAINILLISKQIKIILKYSLKNTNHKIGKAILYDTN